MEEVESLMIFLATLTEMEKFFDILIYGDANWLFLLIFLGIGFLIAWRIRYFSIICVVACIFMMINYSQRSPLTQSSMYSTVILGVGACIFMLRLAGVMDEK